MKKNSKLFFIFMLCINLCSCMGSYKVAKNLSSGNVFINKNLKFREKFTASDLNRFSIVIIPDIQCYTHILAQNTPKEEYNYGYVLYRQTDFIAKNSVKNGGDFSCAIQVGDLVHQKGNFKEEWNLAFLGLSNLNGQLPLLVVPGNHDYDRWIGRTNNIDGSDTYNLYFGPDSELFKDKEWYGGSSANGRNSWIVFNACGYNFLVLGLEILPTKESLDWAQEVINQHPGWPTIYVTHEFISAQIRNEGEPYKNASYTGISSRRIFEHTSPKETWENFISKNDQIFMIICGHSSSEKTGSALRIDKNEMGNTTYTVLSDYQESREYLRRKHIYAGLIQPCGDGWMTILDFDLDENYIYVHTYSSEFDEFRTDNYAELTLPIDWNWDKRFIKIDN